jgi:transcriptional regulator with XRE-family HTH domain
MDRRPMRIKSLAANLTELMKRRGISGRELSRRADVSLDTAGNIVSGRSTSPRARTLQALADVLEVPLSALYGGEPPPDYVAIQLAKTVTVQELAPSSARASGDITGEWTLPAEAVGSRMPERLRLFTAPTGPLPGELRPGDRLLADLSHTDPSPPGIYILTDGKKPFIANVRRSADKRGTLTVEHGGRTE